MTDVLIGLLVVAVLVALIVFGVAGLTSGSTETHHTRVGNCFVSEKVQYDWFKTNTISKKVECLTPEDRAKYDQLQKLKKDLKEEDLD